MPPPSRVATTGQVSRNPVTEAVIEIPSGYVAVNATATVTSFSKKPEIQVEVGGVNLTPQSGDYQIFKGDLSSTSTRYASQIRATVLCVPPSPAPPSQHSSASVNNEPEPDNTPQHSGTEFENFYALTVQIHCARSQTALANWQISTYQKIQAAYQQALSDYNELMRAYKAKLQASPARLLIEILQSQMVDLAIQNFQSATLAEQKATRDYTPRYSQFLLNAFDWESTAIQLTKSKEDSYPPSERNGLLALLSSSDYVIDFVQTEQARVLVSVKPQFARSLLLAFRTGEIWPCEDEIAPCVASDMSTIELLQTQRKTSASRSQDQWTITLPTDMIALSRHDPFA